MVRVSNNVIGASVIGIATLIYLVEAVQLPFGSLMSPAEGFMPVITSIFVLAICILGIGKELIFPTGDSVKRVVELNAEDSPNESANFKRPLKMMIAILVYPVVLSYLGFMLSTITLLFAALRLMEYRSWWLSLLLAIVTTVLVKYIFGDVFGIALPDGIFG
jgi:hypothetical protein